MSCRAMSSVFYCSRCCQRDFGEVFSVLRSLPAVSAPSLPEWEHPKRDPLASIPSTAEQRLGAISTRKAAYCRQNIEVQCHTCPRMLSLDLETDTTAEDTAPSTPDGDAETPVSLDVLEEV